MEKACKLGLRSVVYIYDATYKKSVIKNGRYTDTKGINFKLLKGKNIRLLFISLRTSKDTTGQKKIRYVTRLHFPDLTDILFKIPVGFVMSGGSSSSESLSSELVTGVICFDVCGVVEVLSAAAVST